MKKLLIAFSMLILTTLNSYAPILNIEYIENMEKLTKVVTISKELDINKIGISNIPLNPFIIFDNEEDFRLSSKYGYRMHPILKAVLLHKGIDVIVEKNEPILASGSGQVIKTGYSKFGYGNHVIIKHNDEYSTLYAHLNDINVEEGNYVHYGDIVGLGGQTGLVWGKSCHLHFELRKNNTAIDPLKFIGAKTGKEFANKMYQLKEINDYLFGVS
jgi:murein DD-endopeptidase MepM/ murein hydrolase activator NlpD